MKAPSTFLLLTLRCSLLPPLRPHSSSRLPLRSSHRSFHRKCNLLLPASSSTSPASKPLPPTPHPRPTSNEDTQTDFSAMNILASTPPPTTAIDACLSDGFHLDNGLKIGGGDGCLLLAGEAFSWKPWEAGGRDGDKTRAQMLNTKGQWGVEVEAWGVLDLVHPKPDLLILGLGASIYPLNPDTRRYLNSLGVRVDVLDTRNAAAQFNLLATERGVGNVAAGLIPIGWTGK